MPAYEVKTGRNAVGTWHAEASFDTTDAPRQYAEVSRRRDAVGTVSAGGLTEGEAVAKAIEEANRIYAEGRS